MLCVIYVNMAPGALVQCFYRFGQAKFVNIVLILSPSQIFLLPQLRQKSKLVSKVVKTDTKIIISIPKT